VLQCGCQHKEVDLVKRVPSVLGIVLLTLLLGLPASAPAQPGAKTVVVALFAEPDALNPLVTNLIGSAIVNRTFLDPLVEYDTSGQLRPVLAETIPTLQNGQWKLLPNGKMELTWRLRRENQWHDGRPVTSADVVFTHEAASHPQVPIGYYSCGVKELIESVRATDARTFVVTFKTRYAFATDCPVEGSKYGIVPRHIFEQTFRRDPARVKDLAYGQDPAMTVGNGPFRFRQRVQGSEIVVEAHPTYWRGRAQLDRIVFRFFPDANTIVANVLSGAIHVAAPQPVGINFGQALQVEELIQRGQARNVKVGYRPVSVHEALWFNQAVPVLQDKRVRQALAHATNREAISEALFRGRQPAAHLFLPSNHRMVERDIKTYSYDPERARTLLTEAGWRRGPDGILVNAQGQKLQLVITTTAGNRDRERIEQVLQQQWREVGIDLVIENHPARIVYGELFYTRRYKGIVLGSHPIAPTINIEQFYWSKEVKDVGQVARNALGWSSPQTDEIIAEFVGEPDLAKRRALLSRFQKIWAEELPVLPLYFWVSVWLAHSDLQGFDPPGTAIDPSPITWNARLWRWAR
jgi:peptide/nickel transport system substrate-binding protein